MADFQSKLANIPWTPCQMNLLSPEALFPFSHAIFDFWCVGVGFIGVSPIRHILTSMTLLPPLSVTLTSMAPLSPWSHILAIMISCPHLHGIHTSMPSSPPWHPNFHALHASHLHGLMSSSSSYHSFQDIPLSLVWAKTLLPTGWVLLA